MYRFRAFLYKKLRTIIIYLSVLKWKNRRHSWKVGVVGPIYFSNYGLSMTRECYLLNLVQIGRAVDTTFKSITSMQYIYGLCLIAQTFLVGI